MAVPPPGPKEKEVGAPKEEGGAAAAAPKPKETAAPADDPAPSAGFGSVKEDAGGGAESRAAMLDAGENGGAPVAAASALPKSGLGPAAREEPIATVAVGAREAVPSLQRGCSAPAVRDTVDPPTGGMPVKLKEEAVAEAVEAKLPASDVPAVVAAAAAAVGSGTDDSADLPVPKPPPSELGSSGSAVPAALKKAGSSSSSSSSVPERSCHFFIDDLHASSREKGGGVLAGRGRGWRFRNGRIHLSNTVFYYMAGSNLLSLSHSPQGTRSHNGHTTSIPSFSFVPPFRGRRPPFFFINGPEIH